MDINLLKEHPLNVKIYGEESVADLVEKIGECGYLNDKPLVITKDNIIISGHRRYKACKILGISDVPVTIKEFASEEEELESILLENLYRDKTKEQLINEGNAWAIVESKKAKERQIASRCVPGMKIGEHAKVMVNLPAPSDIPEPLTVINVESGKQENSTEKVSVSKEEGAVRDIVAKRIGMSSKDYDKGKKIVKVMEEKREVGDQITANILGKIFEKSTDAAYNIAKSKAVDILLSSKNIPIWKKGLSENKPIPAILRDIRQNEVRETIISVPIVKNSNFEVILADPPWKYDFSVSLNREIENQYPTMELEDICNLIEKYKIPIDDNAVLFLWVTSPKLIEGLEVLESWEFEYKTNMVWVKDKIGMGYYARSKHELLLIGTKGTIGVPLPENIPESVIQSPRTEHSKKPEELYSIIEKMYPKRNYLEIFARNRRKGWESWGNQL